ncbi:MAG: ATP-binding cassette domain-containing protein [Acinetobacter sp.]
MIPINLAAIHVGHNRMNAQALSFIQNIQQEIPVRVLELTKCFGNEEVLKQVSVEFAKKKIHGIIGKNGSGKTVLFKCICGFLRPNEGNIFVWGNEIGKDCDFPKETGMLIEQPGFLPYESARNNLRWLAKLNKTMSKSRVDEVIRLVGLEPGDKKHIIKYSLGMLQRLGIAQALLDDPKLLILDEPMNGLDKQGVKDMRNLFLNLREQGKTLLLASHFAQDIDMLCDTVYEMDQGILTRRR